MSSSSRRIAELIIAATVGAAITAAAPAVAHGVKHALFAHKAANSAKLGGKLPAAYALRRNLNKLKTRVTSLERKLAPVTYNSTAKLLTFDGVNVRVVDGSGSTDAAPNGLGNLIVGYNADTTSDSGTPDVRTGSHNLVIGDDHTYSSFGGIVGGDNNFVTGPNASVTGGFTNTAAGVYSSVSGGQGNTASGQSSSVSGGQGNTAASGYSSVTGGSANTTSALWEWLAGSITVNTASVAIDATGQSASNGSYDTASVQALCPGSALALGGGAYWGTDDNTSELPMISLRYVQPTATQEGFKARGGNDTNGSETLWVQSVCLGP